MAAFRYVCDLFVSNCKKWYNPSESVTNGDQRMPFKGRYRFIHYIPSKLGKCDIKTFWLCDSTTYYDFNRNVYIKRQPGEKFRKNIGSNTVLKLCTPLHHTSRIVTTNNFFTSAPLNKLLLDKNLTLVGTRRQNIPDITPIMKAVRNWEQCNRPTEFGFKRNTRMGSYIPKKKRQLYRVSLDYHYNFKNLP